VFPRRRTESLSSFPKSQQQVLGTMFGFLSKDLTKLHRINHNVEAGSRPDCRCIPIPGAIRWEV